jgi:hypothetical protein
MKMNFLHCSCVYLVPELAHEPTVKLVVALVLSPIDHIKVAGN